MLIRLEHIEKTYGTPDHPVPVLHDVNFEMQNGAYYAIMGPSGSGKSTLMNILGYLDTPTKGRYFFEDVDNSRASDTQMAKIRNEKIGFVFQSFHLLPRRKAWENVALPLMYGNVPKRERRESVNAAIGTSITPSTTLAINANTAQAPAMTRSFPANVWYGIAASPNPPTSRAEQR